jgi:hypothetical protein
MRTNEPRGGFGRHVVERRLYWRDVNADEASLRMVEVDDRKDGRTEE